MERNLVARRSILSLISAAPLLAGSRRAMAAAPTKIRFLSAAAVARPDLGFMFLGTPLGFYQQLGIEADFITVGGSGTVIQLIATNRGQLGHAGMQELMAAKKAQPNLPVRAVYLQETGSAYEIVAPEDGPITSIEQLKGKSVGVISLASGAVPFVKAMLRRAKIGENSVDLLPVGTGAQALAALKAGRVQALSLFRGSHAALENLGMKLRYFTVPYPSSVLVANDAFLKDNREALVHALQGVVLDTIYMNGDPEGAVRQYWKLFGEPKGDKQKAMQDDVHIIKRAAELWKNPKDSRPWGLMTDNDWLGLARFADIDITPQQVTALYTDELIADVNKINPQIALRAARGG